MEKLVIDRIRHISTSGDMQKSILKEVRGRQQRKNVPMIKEKDKLLLELETMGATFNQWADRLDAGKIDEEQFERQNARLLERKNLLQERLAAIEGELSQQQNLDVTYAEVKAMLNDFPQTWDALELEEQREVLRLLIEELKVYPTHIELKILFLDSVRLSFPAKGKFKEI